ncbi:MAG: MFS transporter [Eggerthellaceae bacterium]|nr:MFS transporter [Eggerthellaceae bacterium]
MKNANGHKSAKLLNPRFLQLLAIEACLQIGVYMLNPLIAGYAVMLGATAAVAGLVAGLNATAAVFTRFVSGALSDRFSRKRLLAASAGVFMLAALGCTLSTSVVELAIFRSLQGVAFAFKSILVVSLVRYVVPPEHLGKGVGVLGMCFTVAMALAPALGEYLAQGWGYQVSFATACALLAVGFILALTFKVPAKPMKSENLAEGDLEGLMADIETPESEKQRLAEEQAKHRAQLAEVEKKAASLKGFKKLKVILQYEMGEIIYVPSLPNMAVACLFSAVQGVIISLLLLIASYEGLENVFVYFIVYAICAFFSRPNIGDLSDKYGIKKLAIPLLAIETVSMVLLAVDFSFPTLMISAVLMGVGQASSLSLFQAESVRIAPPDKTARSVNTFFLGVDLGMGLAPFAAGALLDDFGSFAVFAFCAACALTALIAFVFFYRKRR